MSQRSSLSVLVATLILVGCYVQNTDGSGEDAGGQSAAARDAEFVPDEPTTVDLDTEAVMSSLEPGTAVGLYVESPAAGQWVVSATCDSLAHGACEWKVSIPTGLLADGAPFGAALPAGVTVDGTSVEGTTLVTLVVGDALVRLPIATEGTELEATVSLDGDYRDGQRNTWWVGDGQVHGGVPTNPVRFAARAVTAP